MMFVDADTIEAHAVREFELIEIVIINAVAELRVI
jgi:hypothetical protein